MERSEEGGEGRRLSWRRVMQAGRDSVGRVEERLGGRGRVDNRRVEVVSWWEWMVGLHKWKMWVEVSVVYGLGGGWWRRDGGCVRGRSGAERVGGCDRHPSATM